MAEKHQVDKSIDELVDIRDVKLDSSLGQAERIQSFLQQIKNPYCFRVGDVVVNVAYTEGGPKSWRFKATATQMKTGQRW